MEWRCVFSAVLNELVDLRARMCTVSWFQAFGPATANARVPKCATLEQTTRSPRPMSSGLLLTDVTGRQRSATYDGASPSLYVSRHNLNWTRCETGSQWRRSRNTCLMWSCFLAPTINRAAVLVSGPTTE